MALTTIFHPEHCVDEPCVPRQSGLDDCGLWIVDDNAIVTPVRDEPVPIAAAPCEGVRDAIDADGYEFARHDHLDVAGVRGVGQLHLGAAL